MLGYEGAEKRLFFVIPANLQDYTPRVYMFSSPS